MPRFSTRSGKFFQKNFPPPAARRCVSGRHGRRPGRGSVSHAGNDRLLLLSEPLPQRNFRRLRDHPVHDGRRRLLSCRSLSKAFTFLQNMQICSEHIYFENGDEISVICQKCEIFRAFGVKKDPARLLLQGHFFYCGLQSGFAPKHEVPISACCGWQPVSSLLRSEYINVIKYKRYEIRHSTVPCTIYFIFFLPE